MILAEPAVSRGPFPLVVPSTGETLRPDRPWSLTDGATRWPVVEGIPYLRAGRDGLRRAALDALDSGDERAALVALLADQDDFARTPPPGPDGLARLVEGVDSGRSTLRDAMAGLGFGPVADYFAHRWSAPTYLSGLALLARHRPEGAPVVEVACGIGHTLRDLARHGVACLGVDVVFAKLWLARRFLVPEGVPLACGDAARGLPVGPGPGPAVAFCHDAFYFLPDKPRVVEGLRRIAGEGGLVLIGHAHNSRFDHRGVAGEPRTPEEYAELLPGCRMYDDAELARSIWAGIAPTPRGPARLATVEALAMAWAPSGRFPEPAGSRLDVPPPGVGLRLNPLLAEAGGLLRPRWPSARFEAEYAAESSYLEWPMPRPEVLEAARLGGRGLEVEHLARRRILVDLPDRW